MIWQLLLSSLLATAHPIAIDHHAPTTQCVSFDPQHPPADVEKLHHGEDALTRMLFNCTVKLKYETTEKDFRDGKCHVVTRLGDVKLTLELIDTLYLPQNANAKLKAHELGHARINTMVYESEADSDAQRVAEEAMNRSWEGTGTDEDSAGKAATDAAVEWICHHYLHATADKAYRIGEIYDDLTKHGTNAKQEDDAIREAIQKQSEVKQ